MATKVFISWSGDLSQKLGEALREWLPASLQYVKPYFSPEDIQKGTKWNSEIAKELEDSDVGVICLTSENTEKPWILFEAGALSKSIDKARVCTLLFGIEPADVKGPLTSFQSTRFIRDDFKRFVATVNSVAGESKLDAVVLDNVFDMWWPKLETKVETILNSRERHGQSARRSERDILEEILGLARMTATTKSRPKRISQRAVVDLAERLEEAILMCRHLGPTGHTEHLIELLITLVDGPFRRICKDAGIPSELFARHRANMHYAIEAMEEETVSHRSASTLIGGYDPSEHNEKRS